MDLKTRKQTFLQSGHKWLGSAHALDTAETIELDKALFDLAVTFPNGFIPSGVLLGKVAGTSKWGPYNAGPGSNNEVQSIAVDAGGGTWTAKFDGETTAAVAHNVSAANLLAAFNALSNVDPGDLVVTGGPGAAGGATPYVITFSGDKYADRDVPVIVTDATSLTGGAGTAAVTTTTAGGGAAPATDGRENPVGFLAWPVSVIDANGATEATGPALGALVKHVIVNEAGLPTGHGLDGNAKRILRERGVIFRG